MTLHLALNIIYKNSRFFKVLTQKGLKFISSLQNRIVIFDLVFVLLPVEKDLFF